MSQDVIRPPAKESSTSTAPNQDNWNEAKKWVRQQGLDPCSSRIVGKGSFGTVWPAQSRYNQLIVAVKFSRSFDEEAHEEEKKTLRVLSNRPHPNVVRILAHEAWEQPFWMSAQISELAFSDLQLWLHQHIVDVPAAFFFAKDLASGLSHLHSWQVEHRDLKPSNLLLYVVTAGCPRVQLRIGDFGSSRLSPLIRTSSSRRSKSRCVAPLLHKLKKKNVLERSIIHFLKKKKKRFMNV
jgi:serine/threonine protein kinase